jgi:hypothetical protein
MGNYKLNNVSLESYGVIPIQSSDTNLAITGAWDMPARIGKTFHDWGNNQDGIEPYVLAEEIRFGGIDISLNALVRGSDKNDALRKTYTFYDHLRVPGVLSCDWGSWTVLANGEAKGEYLSEGYARLTIPFRCPVVPMPTSLPTNILTYEPTTDEQGRIILVNGAPLYSSIRKYDGLGIDGVGFDSLGLIITGIDDQFTRPALKGGEVTAYRAEGYRSSALKEREITINAAIVQHDYPAFLSVVNGLKTLFSKPGLRYITRKQDALRDFFVKDGFKITGVRVNDGQVVGFLEVKLTEVDAFLNWHLLANTQGQLINTQLGNIIIT